MANSSVDRSMQIDFSYDYTIILEPLQLQLTVTTEISGKLPPVLLIVSLVNNIEISRCNLPRREKNLDEDIYRCHTYNNPHTHTHTHTTHKHTNTPLIE